MATASEIQEALNWRYACKKFDPDRVLPAADYEALMDSLHLAPSSFGLQPWRFLDIQDQSLRAELKKVSWNQSQVVEASHFLVLAVETRIDELAVDRWVKRLAEVREVTIESLQGYRDVMNGFLSDMNQEAKISWAKRQAYIALGGLMSAAAIMKIDTCPIEGIEPDAYDTILSLADQGLTTTVTCALGYRSAEDHYQKLAKVRYNREDLIKVY